MNENNFYQWPSCRNCESVLPRAVLIQRICNIADFKINVVNVPLPPAGADFKEQLENRLIGLPYLELEGEHFRSSRKIWDYFISHITDSKIKMRLNRNDSIYSFITRQWCNESFINSLIYARWKKEENYQRFISGVDFGSHVTPDMTTTLRKYILSYLKRTAMGDMQTEDYQTLITQQFSSLAAIVEEQPYFEAFAKYPTFTDLYVFMVIQGFLSPDIEESTWIEQTYPSLMRWYKNMELYTGKNPPKDLLG
ncbi:MAG: hypothetical protein V4598_12340 [Bdellovibrionota bacterium]